MNTFVKCSQCGQPIKLTREYNKLFLKYTRLRNDFEKLVEANDKLTHDMKTLKQEIRGFVEELA